MRVALTGAGGMLGRAISRAWAQARPEDELIPIRHSDADLRERDQALKALRGAAPELIVHTAARVGGIAANVADPFAFLSDNLAMDSHVINAALELGVRDLVYFGSSCMYPRDYRQPLVETDVLKAPLEPTNEGYAIAKIAASKLCEYASDKNGVNYRVLIPSNLYGPNDHYGSTGSHLVASAIYKAHTAKEDGADHIDVWGDGTARREFTHVDDVASWVATHVDRIAEWPGMMNIGLGRDHSVREYYEFALAVVGYDCELRLDPSKPAGMHQKLMDSSLAATHGWAPRIDALPGMRQSYEMWRTSLAQDREKRS